MPLADNRTAFAYSQGYTPVEEPFPFACTSNCDEPEFHQKEPKYQHTQHYRGQRRPMSQVIYQENQSQPLRRRQMGVPYCSIFLIKSRGRDVLPHSAIYIKYIAALPIFIVQLVGITSRRISKLFSRTLQGSIGVLHRRIFSDIELRNSRIRGNIKSIRSNSLGIIEMTLKRRTIRNAFKVDATVNIIRKTTSNTLTIDTRNKRAGRSNTGID